ncbi:hypothetical protein M422DRAFT_246956 [Sphaerobolus stellatus SS14]|nr:hypothetical protein M422DRAFT_246956 [Sphaerobolus stellatus SS14]
MPQPSLPLELIVECYRLVFPPDYFSLSSIAEKPPWKDIEGLTLASKHTRELSLSMWFHVLRVQWFDDWEVILEHNDWKRLFRWTRVLWFAESSITHLLALKASNHLPFDATLLFPHFTRVKTLRLSLPPTIKIKSCSGENEEPVGGPQVALTLDALIPPSAAGRIEHLEMHGIAWLDPYVMGNVAERMKRLRTLGFRQPLVWCGVCNTLDVPSFQDNPGKVVYEGGGGLPAAYARFLSPLQELHTVKLTVACHPGGIPYEDLFLSKSTSDRHAPRVSFPDSKNPFSSENSPSDSNQAPASSSDKLAGWAGECDDCMSQLCTDPVLRESWINRRAKDVRASPTSTNGKSNANGHNSASNENTTDTTDTDNTTTPHPPSLTRVEWELLDLNTQNWPDWRAGSYVAPFGWDEDEDDDGQWVEGEWTVNVVGA